MAMGPRLGDILRSENMVLVFPRRLDIVRSPCQGGLPTCANECRIPSGGISTFGNLIIKSFGYNSFETILFNIPFGVIQIIAIIGGGWLATRFQRKGLVIVGFALIAAVGTLLMLVVPREQKGVLLFGYYLVSHSLIIKRPN
jgi:MFS family permease